ncbi:putative cytochrome P450 superfamily [Helianthus anomalus]
MDEQPGAHTQTMIQVLTLVLLFIAVYVFRNVYNKRSKINLPPGSFGWPLLGETLALVRANWDGVPERFVQERIEKHGSPLVFKTSLLGERMAVLCGPAGHKFRFANENKLVGAWWPLPITKLLGESLITTGGDEAKWIRRRMLSYLGPDAFATHYIATMDVVTRRHIDIHWRGTIELTICKDVRISMHITHKHLCNTHIHNILLFFFVKKWCLKVDKYK